MYALRIIDRSDRFDSIRFDSIRFDPIRSDPIRFVYSTAQRMVKRETIAVTQRQCKDLRAAAVRKATAANAPLVDYFRTVQGDVPDRTTSDTPCANHRLVEVQAVLRRLVITHESSGRVMLDPGPLRVAHPRGVACYMLVKTKPSHLMQPFAYVRHKDERWYRFPEDTTTSRHMARTLMKPRPTSPQSSRAPRAKSIKPIYTKPGRGNGPPQYIGRPMKKRITPQLIGPTGMGGGDPLYTNPKRRMVPELIGPTVLGGGNPLYTNPKRRIVPQSIPTPNTQFLNTHLYGVRLAKPYLS